MQKSNFVFDKKKKKKHGLQKILPSKHVFSKKHDKKMNYQTNSYLIANLHRKFNPLSKITI